jgi:hypothetical protein
VGHEKFATTGKIHVTALRSDFYFALRMTKCLKSFALGDEFFIGLGDLICSDERINVHSARIGVFFVTA